MQISKELMKGNIDTIILALLHDQDRYGYELAKYIRIKTMDQFELKEGTLYVSLKRLENQKWVRSYWGDEQGAGGRRKYYTLTNAGCKTLREKKKEWGLMSDIMNGCLSGVTDL
ncbi:PadR family transcriptional regulator [Salibacterium aidingense]|uniref:PadR family transcriptional regulator n=1 Tax=Salibacterium aidingense TaxID=384933 RepID=UPI000400DC25|nr:PadR family transcriptional regulator [Salibacterium aidingense]